MPDEVSNIVSITEDADQLRKLAQALKSGGGDGTSGGMEGRISKIEAHVEHLQSDTSDLKTDVRDLRDRMRAVEVKIDHLPSKGFIVTTVVTLGAIVSGVAVYAEQIRLFLNGTP